MNTESEYFDPLTEKYWSLAQTEPNEIIQEIDKIIKRADWGNDKLTCNWKIETKEADNDARMVINSKTNKIEEFSFRADLREENLQFLLNMIELGKRFNWMFMERKFSQPGF